MKQEPLPDGWAMASIGELLGDGVFVDGDWVESKDQDPEGEVRLTQLADIGDGVWRDRSNRFMTLEKTRVMGCTLLEPGDVLVARMPDPLGRACQFPGSDQPCVTVVDVAILRPGPGSVDPAWLMHAINSPAVRSQIAAMQGGTTRKRISRKNLGTITLPVPPRGEQQRIAHEIERRMAQADHAEGALKTALVKIEQLRSSMIHAAVTSGMGVKPSGQVRDQVRACEVSGAATLQLPGHWTCVPLSSLLREPLRNGKSGKTVPSGTGVRTFTITAVTARDFGMHNAKWAEAVTPEVAAELGVKDGDIFIQRSNTPELVGSAALYRGPNDVAIFPDLLIRVRVGTDVLPEWAELVLRWEQTRRYLRSVASGLSGSMPKVDQGKIASVLVPLPPVEEQRQIIAELDRRLTLVEGAERSARLQLARVRQLRASILVAAMRGQLTAQDPDSEPASVLLERLRASREAASGSSAKKAKKEPAA